MRNTGILASFALAFAMLAPQPAAANHEIGHAIVGGVIGGIIGGAIANSQRPIYQQQPVYVQPQYVEPVYLTPHQQWCLGRWRSYDLRTNTYRPYSGGWRYCSSPYGG